MAVINSGILGEFKGKIGNLKGTKDKGKAVIIAIDQEIKYNLTNDQNLNVSKFGLISNFAKLIRPFIIDRFWIPYKKGATKFQTFIHFNRKFALSGSLIDVCNIDIINSKRSGNRAKSTSLFAQFGFIRFDYVERDPPPFEEPGATVHLLMFNMASSQVITSDIFFTDKEQLIVFLLPPLVDNDKWFSWLIFDQNKKGTLLIAQTYSLSSSFNC